MGIFQKQDNQQTQFTMEEPLYEDVAVPEAPEPEEVEAQRSFFQKYRALIFLAAFILLFTIVVAFLLAVMSRNGGDQNGITVPSPSPQVGEQSPFQRRVDQLRQDLDEADPTTTTRPFPPVDLELRLDSLR